MLVWLAQENNFEMFAAMGHPPLAENVHPQLVTSVCSLGVLRYPSLMLSTNRATSTSNMFYHVQLARRPHPILVNQDLSLVIHTFVTSQREYSVEVYLGMKQSVLSKLQQVQNEAAASLLSKTRL